jgi:hypothetical protein
MHASMRETCRSWPVVIWGCALSLRLPTLLSNKILFVNSLAAELLSVVNASSVMCVSPPSHKSRPVHSEVGTRRERAHPESTPACTRACTPCRRPAVSRAVLSLFESLHRRRIRYFQWWILWSNLTRLRSLAKCSQHNPSCKQICLPLVSTSSPVSRRLQFWNLVLMMWDSTTDGGSPAKLFSLSLSLCLSLSSDRSYLGCKETNGHCTDLQLVKRPSMSPESWTAKWADATIHRRSTLHVLQHPEQ